MKWSFALVIFALLLSASTVQAQKKEAILLNNAAMRFVGMGNTQGALKFHDRAIALDPSFPFFYINRAGTLQKMGRFKEALRDATRAVELDPSSAEAIAFRASVFVSLKQWNRANADFNRAIEIAPHQMSYVHNRGMAREKSDQLSAALRDFHRAIAMRQDGENQGGEDGRFLRENLEIVYENYGLPAFGASASRTSTSNKLSESSRTRNLRFAPRAGEIRFEARCAKFNPKTGELWFDALAFSLPNGRTRSLLAPKRRTATMGRLQLENNPYGELNPKILRADDYLVIVGRDTGKTIAARAVFIAFRTPTEAKKRGAMAPELAGFQLKGGTLPPLDWAAVGRPTFVSSDKTYEAGTAFIVNSPAGKRLICAWHLITDDESNAPDGSGAEFLQKMKQVRVRPFNFAGATEIVATKAVSQQGASFIAGDASHDVLILAAPDDAPKALDLASVAPQPGSIIWIAAQEIGQAKAKLFAVGVFISDDQEMILFPPDNVSFQAMSGAPLLNRDGKVVAMLVGAGKGSLVAVPLPALRARLASEAAQN